MRAIAKLAKLKAIMDRRSVNRAFAVIPYYVWLSAWFGYQLILDRTVQP